MRRRKDLHYGKCLVGRSHPLATGRDSLRDLGCIPNAKPVVYWDGAATQTS
jgi:hypothetical protein